MSIATYAELKTAVADWVHRSDLTSMMDTFVTLAEVRISNDVRTTDTEGSQTITTTAGDDGYALPSDFVQSVRMSDSEGDNLPFVYPTHSLTDDTGEPNSWFIEAGEVRLMPVPDGVYTFTHIYRKRVAALSGTLNSVFQKWPDVYLFATLVEASMYTQDTEIMAMAEQRYQQAVARANRTGNTSKLAVLLTDRVRSSFNIDRIE